MESWKKAIKLDPDDELVGSTLTDGEKFIMLVSQSGKAVFDEKEARSMGRAARGVKGINLAKDDQVISLLVPEKENTIFTVSENGYGKEQTSMTSEKLGEEQRCYCNANL